MAIWQGIPKLTYPYEVTNAFRPNRAMCAGGDSGRGEEVEDRKTGEGRSQEQSRDSTKTVRGGWRSDDSGSTTETTRATRYGVRSIYS